MISNNVSCTYVVTSVTWYRSSVVDLSHSRSVHVVEHDPCCPDPIKLCGTDCRTVHYGLCSPLIKLPSFSIARNDNSPPPSTLESFDPVELLAADLEGKLEALVSSFVAQDKVRLAARRGVGGGGDGQRKVGKDDPSAPTSSWEEAKPQKSSNRILRGKTAQKAEELMRALVNSKQQQQQQQSKGKSISDKYLPLLTSSDKSQAVHTQPKASVEYQQAGVKVQINKFASPSPGVIKNESPPDVAAKGSPKGRVIGVSKLKNGQTSEVKVKWESEEPRKKALSPERNLDIPHPKLTTVQKQHIRERSLSPTERHYGPVRPFLTKGSVAERVLLFERCPERAPERGQSGAVVGKGKTGITSATWKTLSADGTSRTQVLRNKENVEPQTNSLRRLPKTATRASHNIPRFYYPHGKPRDSATVEERLKKVTTVFKGFPNGRATLEHFGEVAKICGVSLYWKAPLFSASGGDKKGFVTTDAFLEYWRRVITTCHDEASLFVRVLSRGQRNYLLPEDLMTMIQDIIETHPGLTFLKVAPEFHSRYVQTVISRVFYVVNKSWSGKVTVPELRKSNFLQVLALLDDEEDINQITEYFSYEHFYVIYCKFWELDKDHDLHIDKVDLSRHNDGAISSRMIDRIFSGAVTRGATEKKGKMSYTEFVWFLISEEDKRHPRSIEYWFRCMDIDGDGFLSMYELEYFYEEQLHRMEALGIETLPFKDCLCQMLDMIRPKVAGQISLTDLKRCKMTPIFFDTFFNLEKYLDHEQRDPFASQRDHEEGVEVSDWARFAAEEYELLVAEENASEHQEEMMYEDYEDGELAVHLDKLSARTSARLNPLLHISGRDLDDDDYDYADSDADYHY